MNRGRTGYLGYYFFQPYEGSDGRDRLAGAGATENGLIIIRNNIFCARSLPTRWQKTVTNFWRKREKAYLINSKPSIRKPFLHPIGKDQKAIRGLKGRSLIILYYADRQGRPAPESKWKRTEPIQSAIHFAADECLIRADGTMGDSELFFSGNLGGRGVAWLLPSDFD